MKSEFLLAITQLSAEKNLPKEVVLAAVESALASAYRKDNFTTTQSVEVKINPNTGKVEVWAEKTAVEVPTDTRREISLKDARLINPEVELEETVMVESTPANAGRIAAQTAKQVILQRLHEAEHSAIFEEYADKESDIVNGVVQRMEARQILLNIGRAEAVLPVAEQMPNERYRIGQRLRVLLLEVVRTTRGPRVIVSRSHPDLVRRLFEIEVPEVFSGAVEIKAVAREAGYRTKVAVAARQEGIDPVGCCVGLRGIRIQNIVNELGGEKIDVVLWDPDVATFIASALSPAQIVSVELNQDDGIATVVVPDRQLSLAIGKEGQNARLSAKLAGWRVDIKSVSVYEQERVEAEADREKEEAVAAEAGVETPETVEAAEISETVLEAVPEAEAVTGVDEASQAEAAETTEEAVFVSPIELEPVLEIEDTEEEEAAEEDEELEEPVPLDTEELISPVPFEMPAIPGMAELRFAEDIIGFRGETRSKRKKKKKTSTQSRSPDSESAAAKRARRQEVTSSDTDDLQP